MSKREEYPIVLNKFIDNNAYEILEEYLRACSNLPGPRGNLELANAFADCLKAKQNIDDNLWKTLNKWTGITAEDTPADSPKEYIPFCAVQALGAIYTFADSEKKERIIELIKSAANDTRWRVREAAAIGLQWIAESDFNQIELIINRWIDDSSLLERRAIIADLSHPPVLHEKRNVLFCLTITDRILEDLLNLPSETRKTEEFRVLKKGLEYAISVFVANLPDKGFEFLEKWAQSNDSDIRKIIKSNLGKSRLTKKYSQQVDGVLAVLTNQDSIRNSSRDAVCDYNLEVQIQR